MTTRPPLDRRAVLRGAGGVAIALPFLEAMLPRRASAAGKPPLRFLAVFESNGYVRDAWKPSGPETGFAFSPVLKPLEPFRDRIVIIDGLNARTRGPGSDHMKGMGSTFTGCELRAGSFGGGGSAAGFANGPSIDQYIASKLGGATRLRSLELGVKCDGKATPETRCFFDLNKSPVPPMNSPAEAFDRLFNGFTAPTPTAGPAAPSTPAAAPAPAPDQKLLQRRAVLDFVIDDYRRLSATLGAADRQRLDAHLGAIEDIQRRLKLTLGAPTAGGGAGAAAVVPATPGQSCAKPSGAFGAGGGSCSAQNDCSDADMLTVGRLQMDLLALAFACDLVRVATLQWSNCGNRIVYRSLGLSETHHDLAHAAARAPLAQINTWYAGHAAHLLGKLQSVKEGDGSSALDNTLVLFGNELSNGASHSHVALPFLLAGGAGGALRTGRFLSFGGTAHNALLVSCLNLMGIPDRSFGTLAPDTGPLPGL